jgi:TolB-like protein
MPRALLVALHLLCLPALPGLASAAEPSTKQRVAIVRVEFQGSIADTAKELLVQKLSDGLTAVDFDVTGGASISNRTIDGAPASACRDESCARRVASELGVAYLINGQVTEKEKSYTVSLELVNGKNGQVVGSNRESCEICGLEEAAEKMSLAAAALRTRLESLVKAPSRVVIRTRPEGARLSIDGKSVGRSPLDVTLTGGRHTVRVNMEGYDPTERTLTVVAGVDENLELDLVRLPTKFPFKTAGWSAIAAGGAALIVGGVLVALDNREVSCQPEDKDPRGHCPEVWDTGLAGAALMGVGAVAGTLGGVWLYLGSPSGGAVGRETASGAIVGARGRF